MTSVRRTPVNTASVSRLKTKLYADGSVCVLARDSTARDVNMNVPPCQQTGTAYQRTFHKPVSTRTVYNKYRNTHTNNVLCLIWCTSWYKILLIFVETCQVICKQVYFTQLFEVIPLFLKRSTYIFVFC